MSKATRPTSPRRGSPAPDEWERQWQQHWSKVGLPGYELPVAARRRRTRIPCHGPHAGQGTRAAQAHQRRVRARLQGALRGRPGGDGLRLRPIQGGPSLLQAGAGRRRRTGQGRLRHADGRRAGHHGGGQSRGARSRRRELRAEHHSAARAGDESLRGS